MQQRLPTTITKRGGANYAPWTSTFGKSAAARSAFSAVVLDGPVRAWNISFGVGFVNVGFKDGKHIYVRAVRSGP